MAYGSAPRLSRRKAYSNSARVQFDGVVWQSHPVESHSRWHRRGEVLSGVGAGGADYGRRRVGPRKRYVDSRMFDRCSISMSTRLSPMPNPPCGGTP